MTKKCSGQTRKGHSITIVVVKWPYTKSTTNDYGSLAFFVYVPLTYILYSGAADRKSRGTIDIFTP